MGTTLKERKDINKYLENVRQILKEGLSDNYKMISGIVDEFISTLSEMRYDELYKKVLSLLRILQKIDSSDREKIKTEISNEIIKT